jgi:hypothetical protein
MDSPVKPENDWERGIFRRGAPENDREGMGPSGRFRIAVAEGFLWVMGINVQASGLERIVWKVEKGSRGL